MGFKGIVSVQTYTYKIDEMWHFMQRALCQLEDLNLIKMITVATL